MNTEENRSRGSISRLCVSHVPKRYFIKRKGKRRCWGRRDSVFGDGGTRGETWVWISSDAGNKHWPACVFFFFFLTSDATCETINPGPAEQSDCGNRLCMSVIGKSGGESETAASAILSVHENVQPSSQMIWASVYQKTLSQPTFRQIYSGDVWFLWRPQPDFLSLNCVNGC